jgi:hypothetical protein
VSDRVEVEVPQQIRDLNRDVAMSAGVLFINSIPFFITDSRRIHFVTTNIIARCNKPEITSSLKLVNNFYLACGYKICTCFTNGEFQYLRHALEGLEIDTSTHSE